MAATKKFKVAYLDVDNTIVEQGSNEVKPEYMLLIQRLRELDYMIILFTARPVHPASQWIRDFVAQGVPFDHIIQKMLSDEFIVIDDCLAGGWDNIHSAVEALELREGVK